MTHNRAHAAATLKLRHVNDKAKIELDLSQMNIDEVPYEIGSCRQLETLFLYANELTELPDSMEWLSDLKVLSLSYNHFVELPKVLEKLTKLQQLDIVSIEMETLPEWLGDLRQLSILDARNNQLKDLPSSLAELENLIELKLDGNPLNPELSEAYMQGIESVKAYLRAKTKAQIVLDEAKLILIGEGEVGKTCLTDALLDNEWQVHPSTHGIRIKPINLTDSNTKKESLLMHGISADRRSIVPLTNCSLAHLPSISSSGNHAKVLSKVSSKNGFN